MLGLFVFPALVLLASQSNLFQKCFFCYVGTFLQQVIMVNVAQEVQPLTTFLSLENR